MRPHHPSPALITSAAKRQNGGNNRTPKKDPTTCLAQGCDTVVPHHVRLCRLHYHECVAGKHATLPLRTGGSAHYDLKTNRVLYPSTAPVVGKTKPTTGPKVTIKANVAFAFPLVSAGPDDVPSISCLSSAPSSLSLLFHVDSGAGQSLCCCEDAFVSLRSCAIEVVGVSGSLPIYGAGTAAFTVTDSVGQLATVLVHNCLLSPGGSFNLLSVSQLQHSRQNSVDFNPESPHLRLQSSAGLCHVPLTMTDGLYSVPMASLSVNDERYLTQPIFDLTEKGRYVPPTTAVPDVSTVPAATRSTFGSWVCRMFVAPSS
jgi:hypothetical protein